MASVISSARTSTASLFGVIGSSAEVVSQLLNTASLSVNALDHKARLMHTSITTNCKAQTVLVTKREIYLAASEYTDMMEEVHRHNFPSKEFDREAFFTEALNQITTAVDA